MSDEPSEQAPKNKAVSPALQSFVIESIRHELDKERQWIASSLGVSVKVIVAAGIVVLAVAGFFIGKNFIEVADKARQEVVASAKAQLQLDNPNSDLARNLQQITDEAILNTALIRKARLDAATELRAEFIAVAETSLGQNTISTVSVAPHIRSYNVPIPPGRVEVVRHSDALRILNLITSKAVDVRTFQDAILLLLQVDNAEVMSDFERTVVDLLVGQKPEFAWINQQREKRSVLFTVLGNNANRFDSYFSELVRWTPLLRPRGAIFKLVFGEVCSGFFVRCFSRASIHLEGESDRTNGLAAPSSRFLGFSFLPPTAV